MDVAFRCIRRSQENKDLYGFAETDIPAAMHVIRGGHSMCCWSSRELKEMVLRCLQQIRSTGCAFAYLLGPSWLAKMECVATISTSHKHTDKKQESQQEEERKGWKDVERQ